MKQRWTFRIYPTPKQKIELARTFGCVRYAWNWGLKLRSDSYKSGVRIGYPESDKRLNALKKLPETYWLTEVSSVPLQQSLRDLQRAYSAFFAKRAKYPVFKRKDAQQSAEYTRNGFNFDPDARTLRLAKLGTIKVRWSRPVIPAPSSLRVIRRTSGQYFVSLVVETNPALLPTTGQCVGIDFGVSRFATLSTGETIANPKYASRYARRMAWLQRQLARKQKGSNRRRKCKQRLARLHDKVANCRADTIKKFAWETVKKFDVIYVEDLNLRGMVKNHRLARSLSDVGIGMAIRTLESKAEMHGRKVIRIDRWFPSSKTCSACGHVVKTLPLRIREWACCECGVIHDRDENASFNILAAGQAVTVHGAGVSAVGPKGRTANLLRSANQLGIRQVA